MTRARARIGLLCWFLVLLPFKLVWLVVAGGPVHDPEESEKWAGR